MAIENLSSPSNWRAERGKVNRMMQELYAALHQHSNKAVLDATTAAFTTAEKAKLAGITDKFKGLFANAAARNAAVTSPARGDYVLQDDTDTLWFYDGAAWVDTAPVAVKEYLCAVATVAQTMTTGTFQSVNFDRVDAQIGDYLSITVGNFTYNGTAYVSTSGAEINLKEGRTYELTAGIASTFAGFGQLVLQFEEQGQPLGSEMQIVAVNGGSNIAHNPTAIAIVPPVVGRNRAVRLVAKTIPANGVTLTAGRCWLRVREI